MMADDAELVLLAAQRLRQAWQHEVTIGDVLVAMSYRCAFVTARPDGTTVVVKADTRPGHTAAERRITVAARAAGVPVPAVDPAADTVPGQDLPLLVLDYVPGRPLSADAPGSAWAEAGRVLRRLHDMRDPGGLKPWPEPPADTGLGSGLPLRSALAGHAAREAAGTVKRGLLSSEQAARLGRLLGEAFSHPEARSAADPRRHRVLHGDCQPDHFLLADTGNGLAAAGTAREAAAAGGWPEPDAPGGWPATGPAASWPYAAAPVPVPGIAAVLDLGDACTGDPVWDLAVLTLDHPGRLDEVMAGYAPPDELARRVAVLTQPYRLLRWLGEASWLHDHGFDPEPSIAPLRAVAG
jgi:Ser/Thr protein kinase RdoA (MazF antagonist)